MAHGTYAAKARYKQEVQPTPDHAHNAEVIPATLVLPDGVTVSPTALVCDRELPFAAWKSLGGTLSKFERSIQWWLGDWWHYGFHRYGERKAMTTAKAAFDRSYAFGTLMNYGSVSGRVETSRRREVLSWSHHCEIAKLPAVEQDYWLGVAVKDKLSVSKLRSEIATAEWMAHFHRRNALDSDAIADEELQWYLRRLENAAKIDGRLDIVRPWEWPGLKEYLEQRCNPFAWTSLAIACQDVAIFWSKTSRFVTATRTDAFAPSTPSERVDREPAPVFELEAAE